MKLIYINKSTVFKNIFVPYIKSLYKDSILAFDTESTGLDPHTAESRLMQFYLHGSDSVILLDLFKLKPFDAWLYKTFECIAKSKCYFVAHNWKFDIQFLWKYGINTHHLNLHDTMIMGAIIDAGLGESMSLKNLCNIHLNVELSKDEQVSDWSQDELTDEQKQYAAEDAYYTSLLFDHLTSTYSDSFNHAVYELEMGALPGIASMEYNGTSFNTDILPILDKHYTDVVENAKANISAQMHEWHHYDIDGNVTVEHIDIESPLQLLKGLRWLRIPDPVVRDDYITSTGSNHLSLLSEKDYPIIKDIKVLRGANKLLSSYIKTLPHLINPVTGKIHPNFRQLVRTGRMSCSNPNLQNIPRPSRDVEVSLRQGFIPSLGYVLLDSDYSQIELRVLAEVIYKQINDRVMLDEFLEHKDPYVATACVIYGMSYEEMLELKKSDPGKYKQLRQQAKPIKLGLNYVMGAYKLWLSAVSGYGLDMSLAEATKHREVYLNHYEGLTKYHELAFDKNITEAYTLPPYNRKRRWKVYPGPASIVNHPIQGSSADIMKLAIKLAYERLYDKGYYPWDTDADMKLLLVVHDELVFEVKEHLQEEGSKLVSDIMLDAAQAILTNCPVEAEVNVCANLSEK